MARPNQVAGSLTYQSLLHFLTSNLIHRRLHLSQQLSILQTTYLVYAVPTALCSCTVLILILEHPYLLDTPPYIYCVRFYRPHTCIAEFNYLSFSFSFLICSSAFSKLLFLHLISYKSLISWSSSSCSTSSFKTTSSLITSSCCSSNVHSFDVRQYFSGGKRNPYV
jgi:hypothetical protein